ncbi:MAG: 50S ribosomal protein L11 methyltransferase [Magnetococcales bacterium]|nr:50S ribosomal protein L11 methyltransferase [Magnetococcales bacterium]
MVWEVQLLAPEGSEETYGEVLNEAGSLGYAMEWLPENQTRIWVKGYFPDDTPCDMVQSNLIVRLAAHRLTVTTEGIRWHRLPDQDWAEAWKKDWKPIEVGQSFLIRPSWWPNEVTTRKVLSIDPGLAFGSGSHETTSGCLEAMEWIHARGPLGAFLDMGCGSGILAMGAALLKAAPITACDLDPQAIATCQDNCRFNRIDGIETVLSHEVPQGPFATIVANILAGVLLENAGELVKQLSYGGHLILSGLLDHQQREVESVYAQRGMLSEKIILKAPWVTLIMGRSS